MAFQYIHNGRVVALTNASAFPVEMDARFSSRYAPAVATPTAQHYQQRPSWESSRARSAPMVMARGPAHFMPAPSHYAPNPTVQMALSGHDTIRGIHHDSPLVARRDSISSNCSNSSLEGRMAALNMMGSSMGSLPGLNSDVSPNLWTGSSAPIPATPPQAMSLSASPVSMSPATGPIPSTQAAPSSFRRLVCFKFLREGYCQDGDQCKYEHVAPDDVQEERSLSKAPCAQFMKLGTCAKHAAGEACPYRHHRVKNVPEPKMTVAGFEAVAEKDPKSKDQMCFEFANNGLCIYGKHCRYEHIQKVCYQYVNSGKCHYDNCKYLHTREEKFKLCPEFVKTEKCTKEGCRLKHELPNHKRQLNPAHRDSRIGVRIEKESVTAADLPNQLLPAPAVTESAGRIVRRSRSMPVVPPSEAVRRHRSALLRRCSQPIQPSPVPTFRPAVTVPAVPSKRCVYNQPPSPISSNLGPTPILRAFNSSESKVEEIDDVPVKLDPSIIAQLDIGCRASIEEVKHSQPRVISAEQTDSDALERSEDVPKVPVHSTAAALLLTPRSSRSK